MSQLSIPLTARCMSLLPVNVDLADIEKSLREIAEQIESKGYSRAIDSNVLVVAPAHSEAWKGTLEELTKLTPGRFFVLSIGRVEKHAHLTVMCHSSGSSTVCSEVVHLQIQAGQEEGLPSLLRAHLLPTVPLHLVVLDPSLDLQLLKTLISLAETIYLDSEEVQDPAGLLAIIEERKLQVVDLQWLALSPWRESIKSSFDRSSMIERLPLIQKIVIRGRSSSTRDVPVSMLLLAGWVAGRLGLSLEGEGRSSPLSFSRDSGERVFIEFVMEGGDAPRLDVLHLLDGSGAPLLELRHQGDRGALEALIHEQLEVKILHPFEDLTSTELLARYFLVGESTSNYCSASRLAVELSKRI